MLRRTSEPLALSEASLLALRASMNAPVLSVDYLPVGPARAAIVVFAEEYGGIGLAIGVRSNENGQIAVFRNQAPIDASTRVSDVLEPALATAERMGFLFDDDLIAGGASGGGRGQAMEIWAALMGELDEPGAPDPDPADGATEPLDGLDPAGLARADDEDDDDELLLDDLAEVDLEEISLDLELGDELSEAAVEATAVDEAPAAKRSRQPKPAPASRKSAAARSLPPSAKRTEPDAGPSLSKFRGAPAGAETEEGEGTPSELARIPLKKLRREGTRRVPYLARLLSSF
jgi:hypothetical protein